MKPDDERFDALVSRGFDAGNFANAYETQDYDAAIGNRRVSRDKGPFGLAFILGFFGSYELHEMGAHRETYLEAYRSDAGKRALALGYIDARDESEETDE